MKIEVEIDDVDAGKYARALRLLCPDESLEIMESKTDLEIATAVFQNLADNHAINAYSTLPRRMEELKKLFT